MFDSKCAQGSYTRYEQRFVFAIIKLGQNFYWIYVTEMNWKILIIRRDITSTIFTQESFVPNLDSIPLIDVRQFYNKKS